MFLPQAYKQPYNVLPPPQDNTQGQTVPMEQPGHDNVFVQYFIFSILALLHSLQHLSQHGEGVCRMENQEDVGCAIKSRDRVASRG